jgi:hypothetical protein
MNVRIDNLVDRSVVKAGVAMATLFLCSGFKGGPCTASAFMAAGATA